MLRILLIGLITYLVFPFLKSFGKGHQPAAKLRPTTKPKQTDEMISCDACGTFILQKEALQKQHKFYCSNECLQNNQSS